MKDYQKRLLEETRQEAIKLQKLNEFMSGDVFPTLPREKKTLLYKQCRIMNSFVEVLGERLELENIQFSHEKGEQL